jgi:hypothetical protein
MGVGGQRHPPERPGTHCIEDWVGPSSGLDGFEKILPLPGIDPRTVQPLAIRYNKSLVQVNKGETN